MILPSYVIQQNVHGDGDAENVVILQQTSAHQIVLLWDYLDEIGQAQFDAVSTSPNIITTLKTTTFRNTTLYEYLKHAILFVNIANEEVAIREDAASILDAVTTNGVLSVGSYDINGALGTYQPTNVFSYVSSYGPSIRRDVITANNSGTVTSDSGKIRLSTGTTTGTTVNVDTVERGRYIPGKSAEAGVAVFLESPLTGDDEVTVGLGDDDNGAFFHITATGLSVSVVRGGVLIHSATSDQFVFNKLDGLPPASGGKIVNYDPLNEGYVYVIRYNWYGVGKILFNIGLPIAGDPVPLTGVVCHEYIPASDGAGTFIDPNLPVRVTITNGTTTDNVVADIGGRRFDVLGEYLPEVRNTNILRTVTSLTARRAVFGIRRKADFPVAGRINSLPVYLNGFDINLDTTARLRVYTAPRGTLTGVYTDLPDVIDQGETGLEYLPVVQDISGVANRELVAGPFLILGNRTNAQILSSIKGRKIPVIDDQELIFEIEPDATATGIVVGELNEEW